MSEELDVLKDVVRRLEAAGLAYMVTGSIAASYYGRPRMTRDIDIVLEVDVGAAGSVRSLFDPDYYIDEDAVREAIVRQDTFNIIHSTLIVKVDFIVRKREAYREEEFRRRRRVTIDDLEMYMVAPEDLVLSKLVWAKDSHSERQIADVVSIIRTQDLDVKYVEYWARLLGVSDFYKEARDS